MEFYGQYLTYEQYIILGGGTLDQAPFNLLEFKARKIIDKYTFERLKEAEKTDTILTCMYELITTMSTNGKYLDAKSEQKRIDIEKSIVYRYLENYIVDNQHVLFRG